MLPVGIDVVLRTSFASLPYHSSTSFQEAVPRVKEMVRSAASGSALGSAGFLGSGAFLVSVFGAGGWATAQAAAPPTPSSAAKAAGSQRRTFQLFFKTSSRGLIDFPQNALCRSADLGP